MASNETVIRTVTDHIDKLRIDVAVNMAAVQALRESHEREIEVSKDIHGALSESIEKHQETLFGNGKPGLTDDVRDIKRYLKLALWALGIYGATIIADFAKGMIK